MADQPPTNHHSVTQDQMVSPQSDTSSRSGKMQAQMEAVWKELERSRKELERTRTELERTRTESERTRTHMNEKLAAMQLGLTATQQTLAETQQTLAETQQKLTETQQKLTETQQTLAETQQTLAETQQTLAETQQKLLKSESRNEANLTVARKDKQEFSRQLNLLKHQLAMAQQDRKEVREKVANLEGTLARIQFRDSLSTYRDRFIRAFRNLKMLPDDQFTDKEVLEMIRAEMDKSESESLATLFEACREFDKDALNYTLHACLKYNKLAHVGVYSKRKPSKHDRETQLKLAQQVTPDKVQYSTAVVNYLFDYWKRSSRPGTPANHSGSSSRAASPPSSPMLERLRIV